MAIYTIPICFLFILPLICLLKVCVFRNQKTNHPPQPPKLPIIGNLHQIGNVPHQSLSLLAKKHGPVMLLHLGSVPTVIISSPESAKEAMKTHDIHCCSRPASAGAKRLTYNFKDVGFSPYSEYWREMRKITTLELFSMKRVTKFLPIREEEVDSMIESISQSASLSTPVNFTELMFGLTAGVISKVAFGRSFKKSKLDKENFQEIIRETGCLMGSFAASNFFPYLGWILDKFTGLHARVERVYRELDGFFQNVIDDHSHPDRTITRDQEDVIDVMLKIERDNGESSLHWFTKDHIKAVLLNIFIGGVDTGAITMVWAMSELIKHPNQMKKVQDEIRSCVGNKGKVTNQDLDQLQYLKMVIKETLRLHPAAPLIIQETMRHIKIQGYDIYPKTRMQINVWAIGRDPNVWNEPNDFNPERFLNNSIDFKGHSFELLPFGAGRRICPGISMATALIELALANLLYSFDWKLPDGMKEGDVSMEEESGITTGKKIPLKLVPIKYQWPEGKAVNNFA